MKIENLLQNLQSNTEQRAKALDEQATSVTEQHLKNYSELLQSNLNTTQNIIVEQNQALSQALSQQSQKLTQELTQAHRIAIESSQNAIQSMIEQTQSMTAQLQEQAIKSEQTLKTAFKLTKIKGVVMGVLVTLILLLLAFLGYTTHKLTAARTELQAIQEQLNSSATTKALQKVTIYEQDNKIFIKTQEKYKNKAVIGQHKGNKVMMIEP